MTTAIRWHEILIKCFEEETLPQFPNPEASQESEVRRTPTELCKKVLDTIHGTHEERFLYAAHRQTELEPKHPRYKPQLCRSFHQQGFCSQGSRCRFIHLIDNFSEAKTPELSFDFFSSHFPKALPQEEERPLPIFTSLRQGIDLSKKG
jgi:hypothetical protein